jgi:hypothetical protein
MGDMEWVDDEDAIIPERALDNLVKALDLLKKQKVALVKENMKLKSIICDLEMELGILKEKKGKILTTTLLYFVSVVIK